MAKQDIPEPPITKLNAARRQLVTALRLFFEGRDPVSVYALAHAAMEVLDALCGHNGKTAFLDQIACDNRFTRDEAVRIAEYGKNFFKHADRDPEATLNDFYDGRNDGVFFVAIQDLKTLQDNRLPLEAQAFETWFAAAFPEKVVGGREDYLELIEELYPNFRTKSREELKQMTHNRIQEGRSDGSVMGDPKTDRTTIL